MVTSYALTVDDVVQREGERFDAENEVYEIFKIVLSSKLLCGVFLNEINIQSTHLHLAFLKGKFVSRVKAEVYLVLQGLRKTHK